MNPFEIYFIHSASLFFGGSFGWLHVVDHWFLWLSSMPWHGYTSLLNHSSFERHLGSL